MLLGLRRQFPHSRCNITTEAVLTVPKQDQIALRDAWTNHCNALIEVGNEAIDGKLGDARDSNELAELLRSIGRIASMCLMHRLDFNDTDFPLFLRQMDDRFRYGGPDNNIAYFQTALNGSATYRIRGNNGARALNVGTLWGKKHRYG